MQGATTVFNLCRHIKPNGLKCNSPALRSQSYCYYHEALYRVRNPSASDHKAPLNLPPLEDLSGIQLAVQEVLGAVASTRIDSKRATVILRGLELAGRLSQRITSEFSVESVQEITCDEHGNPLAIAEAQCEFPQDCPDCLRRQTCQMFLLYARKGRAIPRKTAVPDDHQISNLISNQASNQASNQVSNQASNQVSNQVANEKK
jgi:hypothetical protein